jgi:hypothetical protein
MSNLYLTDYCSAMYISIPCSKMHRNPKLISWHPESKAANPRHDQDSGTRVRNKVDFDLA